MPVHQNRVLGASVGAGGRGGNRPADVRIVQHLLNRVGRSALPEDGRCSPELIGRIRSFQRESLRFAHPDGRVDPSGRTIRGLLAKAATAPPPRVTKPAEHSMLDDIGAGMASLRDAMWRELSAMFRGKSQSTKLRSRGPGAVGAGQSKPIAKPETAAPLAGVTDADFEAAAQRLGPGIDPLLVRAVAQVESGGRSGFGAGGLPIIAFEGHWFRKYTKKQYDQTHPLLSYPYKKKAGPEWQTNNKDQASAWRTLRSAIELDEEAALKSCSWGMCQVMGFNYAACGYRDVFAFVDAMKRGSKGQLDAFVGYCRSRPGMAAAFRAKNFAAIAYAYNGEDYGDYDKRFERAYNRLKGK